MVKPFPKASFLARWYAADFRETLAFWAAIFFVFSSSSMSQVSFFGFLLFLEVSGALSLAPVPEAWLFSAGIAPLAPASFLFFFPSPLTVSLFSSLVRVLRLLQSVLEPALYSQVSSSSDASIGLSLFLRVGKASAGAEPPSMSAPPTCFAFDLAFDLVLGLTDALGTPFLEVEASALGFRLQHQSSSCECVWAAQRAALQVRSE